MGTTDIDEIGPVDIIIIGFPAGAPMTGEAVPILIDLVERGIVRVLDVMFIIKNADGTFSGFDAQGLDADQMGDLVMFEGASSGLLGDDDLAVAAEAMDPGEAAVLLVYENRWAAPFAAAVRRNGGRLLASERVTVQDFADALERISG